MASPFLERAKSIAANLGLSQESVASHFPHLSSPSPYTFTGNINFKDEDLPHFIDHTLLRPQATEKDIYQLCKEASDFKFKAVCVNGANTALAVSQLKQTGGPLVAVVVGFPLGASTSRSKIAEATEAVKLGGSEIDMVINVGWIKDGPSKYKNIFEEISGIVVGVGRNVAVKVILETGMLTDAEIVDACILCAYAGAAFVKTSTGFGLGGATTEHVALMRNVVGDQVGVKASGGIRSLEEARAMIKAGATRLGTSSGVTLVKGIVSSSMY